MTLQEVLIEEIVDLHIEIKAIHACLLASNVELGPLEEARLNLEKERDATRTALVARLSTPPSIS